jgi:hypothetical protein
VRFVGDKKTWLPKLGIGMALVLAGIVIGVIGVFAIAVLNQPTQQELEAIRLQDSVEYITTEQKRLGANCNESRTAIRDFLERDVKPVMKAHQPGRNWYEDINADVRKRTEKLRYQYAACERLYAEAQRAKWDGLREFGFTAGLETELIILNTLLRFEFCDTRDAECLDQDFLDLQDAVTKIETRLALK